MKRGPLISLLRLLAVIPAAFGSLPILSPSPKITSSSVPHQPLWNPSPVPAKINSLASPTITPEQDTILVADLDGTIYKLDIPSNTILWSFSSGTSIYDSYQAPNFVDGEHRSSRQRNNFYIDCGDDWELYLHGNDSKKVKLPFGAEELVRRTPHASADGDMVGSKKTTIFRVDPKSGRIISIVRSNDHEGKSVEQNPLILKEDAEKWKHSTALDFETVDQLLYIKRTDYGVTYSSRGNVLWYLTVAEFEASYQCPGYDSFLGLEYKSDAHFQDYCHSNPLVHRSRDRRFIESLIKASRLPTLQGGEMLLLPGPTGEKALSQIVPYQLPQSLYVRNKDTFPAQPWVHWDNEAGQLAIYAEGSGMSSRGREYDSQTNISIPPENLASFPVWLFGQFLAAFFFITALLFYCWNSVSGKRAGGNVQDIKVQSVTSKKKKPRKSGSSRVGTSIEKGAIETTESHMRLTLDNDKGLAHGRKIGKLFVSEKEIAKGSNGTIVLEGVYDARPVAVKRLVKVHNDVALKEIQNLILSDQHPNIVRWYGVEYDQDFIYISLERCNCSLYDLIISHTKDQDPYLNSDSTAQLQMTVEVFKDFKLWKADGYPSAQLLKVMRDTVKGLVHLHELGIIHRDLKPQNVLIRKDNSLSAKVSDMGISKRLSADMSSLTKNATGYGSSGWQAPEQLRHERQTRAVDLFSLGCLLFFCITGGKHPFGDVYERDINIVNDRKDLFLVENIPEAFDLISRLLDPQPESRPKATEVMHHPLFWDPEMRLSFLRDASDRVELEDRDNDSNVLKALESIGPVALGGKWDEKLDSTFLSDIGRYRKYKYDSVRDLLRVIRNKLNHYRELPKEIQGVLGQVPTGFENYFNSRFPKLLIEVYKVLKQYCGEEEFLEKYFRNNQL